MALVALSTLQDVNIPFLGDIPQPMCEGRQIFIQGCTNNTQEGFAVNLQCGRQKYPELDVALHFNPRPTETCVVRNAHEHGGWGREERTGGYPFLTGDVFEIIILVEKQQYKIAVNGKHFATFEHRIPISRVTTLGIRGPVHVFYLRYDNPAPQSYSPNPMGTYPPQIGFQTGQGMGNAAGMNYPPEAGYPLQSQPIYNPLVPFVTGIPGGLYPGRLIYVTGRTLDSGKRFSFNIISTQNLDSSDILFHFDVRIEYGADNNTIVRNTRYDDVWGTEERQIPYFPFVRGAPFQVMMLMEKNKCKVAVNNQHFLEYTHRVRQGDHLGRFSNFQVSGDIELHQVRFQ